MFNRKTGQISNLWLFGFFLFYNISVIVSHWRIECTAFHIKANMSFSHFASHATNQIEDDKSSNEPLRWNISNGFFFICNLLLMWIKNGFRFYKKRRINDKWRIRRISGEKAKNIFVWIIALRLCSFQLINLFSFYFAYSVAHASNLEFSHSSFDQKNSRRQNNYIFFSWFFLKNILQAKHSESKRKSKSKCYF